MNKLAISFFAQQALDAARRILGRRMAAPSKEPRSNRRGAWRFADARGTPVTFVSDACKAPICAQTLDVSEDGMRVWSADHIPLTSLLEGSLCIGSVTRSALFEVVWCRAKATGGFEYGLQCRAGGFSCDHLKEYLADLLRWSGFNRRYTFQVLC